MLVTSSAKSSVSLCSYTSVTGRPVGVLSASISLAFHISNGVVKMFLKTMGREKMSIKILFYWSKTN